MQQQQIGDNMNIDLNDIISDYVLTHDPDSLDIKQTIRYFNHLLLVNLYCVECKITVGLNNQKGIYIKIRYREEKEDTSFKEVVANSALVSEHDKLRILKDHTDMKEGV